MTIGSVNGRAVIGGDLLVKNVSYKDTPVTVTSWSYLTTTITLNVASHTFLANDYIEVGGLTATTNIPNGVHLITSVTATTIVFTYALTPTGTAGVSSATVKGYMTTNGRIESTGIGQTWQAVTRTTGTIYTNSTGKPIVLKALAVSGSVANGLTMTIGSLTMSQVIGATGNAPILMEVIIPNNTTYSMVFATTINFYELR